MHSKLIFFCFITILLLNLGCIPRVVIIQNSIQFKLYDWLKVKIHCHFLTLLHSEREFLVTFHRLMSYAMRSQREFLSHVPSIGAISFEVRKTISKWREHHSMTRCSLVIPNMKPKLLWSNKFLMQWSAVVRRQYEKCIYSTIFGNTKSYYIINTCIVAYPIFILFQYFITVRSTLYIFLYRSTLLLYNQI